MSVKKFKGRKATAQYYPAVHTDASRQKTVPVFGLVGADKGSSRRAAGREGAGAGHTASGSCVNCARPMGHILWCYFSFSAEV